jgi:hypothetical protein
MAKLETIIWIVGIWFLQFALSINRYTLSLRIFKVTTKEVKKTFDSVSFFRGVKQEMAKMMEGMTLGEKKSSCEK